MTLKWAELRIELTPTCIRVVDKPCCEVEPRCHDCDSAQLMVSRRIDDEPPATACPDCGQTVGHYDDCPVGMGVMPK